MPRAERARLTSAFVADAPSSPNGATFYRDTQLPGFALRVSGETKTYVVEGTVRGGPRVRYSLGRAQVLACEAARTLARVRLGEMATGIDPVTRDREKRAAEQHARVARRAARRESAITLRQAVDDYVAARDLKTSTNHDYVTEIPRLLGDWMALPITGISRDMVEQRYRQLCARPLTYTDRRGKTRTRRTAGGQCLVGGTASAGKVMRMLRAVLAYAVEKYRTSDGSPLLPSNPVRVLTGLRLWKPPKRRITYIPVETLPALLTALAPTGNAERDTIRDLLTMCLFCGCRRNEAATLRWSDVDFERGTLTFRDTKNRRDHILPIPLTVSAMLVRRRQTNPLSPFVFPARTRQGHVMNVNKALIELRAVVGMRFTPHDLRRSLVTYATEYCDIDESAVARIVNHATHSATRKNMTESYIIRQLDAARRRLRVIEKFILTAAGRQAGAASEFRKEPLEQGA